jgi:hypothetical protein
LQVAEPKDAQRGTQRCAINFAPARGLAAGAEAQANPPYGSARAVLETKATR